jgi:hypothetical protein
MIVMPKLPPPQKTVEIDEEFLQQWLAWGFKEMAISLGNHTAFAEYEKTHPRKDAA